MSVIRHVPFLKALASAKGSNDPIWRDASTGFLVLRFFDRWLEDGPAAMSADPGLAALRARLRSSEDVEPHVRHLLLTAVNALIDAESTDPAPVSGPILAYGAYLESVGRVALAAHVYVTVAVAMDENFLSDPISTASAYLQHGAAARRAGEFAAAHATYNRVIEIGEQIDSPALILRAHTGVANIAKASGDLQEAESMLDRTVGEADHALTSGAFASSGREALTQASYLARQARAAVRQARGSSVEALRDYLTALQMAFDRGQYEIILSELAACAETAGYRSIARDAYITLGRTAYAPPARSAALVNVLELVVLDGDRAGLQSARDAIAEYIEEYQEMSPEHAAFAALYEAYATEQFESRDAAIVAYREAAANARTNAIHQVEFLAEQRLAAVLAGASLDGPPMPASPAREIPEQLRDVATAVAELALVRT